MLGTQDAVDRPQANWGVPWEESYGYAQAVRAGDTIYVSGQLSHDEAGNLVAPAPVGPDGRVTSFANMEAQMRQTYANAERLLAKLGADMRDVVEETLFVLDVDTAFAAAGPVRREAYRAQRPQCASNLIGTPRLALPEQLIEITFKAVVRDTGERREVTR